MAEKKWQHPEYEVKDGQLVCARCGEPSPRARLVDGEIVRVGEKAIVCPKCGHVIQEAAGNKNETDHEDKSVKAGKAGRASKG